MIYLIGLDPKFAQTIIAEPIFQPNGGGLERQTDVSRAIPIPQLVEDEVPYTTQYPT